MAGGAVPPELPPIPDDLRPEQGQSLLSSILGTLQSAGVSIGGSIADAIRTVREYLSEGNLSGAKQAFQALESAALQSLLRSSGQSGFQAARPPPKPRAARGSKIHDEHHGGSPFNQDLSTGEPSDRVLKRDAFRALGQSVSTGGSFTDMLNHSRGIQGRQEHHDLRAHTGNRALKPQMLMISQLGPQYFFPAATPNQHTLPFLAHPRDLNSLNSLRSVTDKNLRHLVSEEQEREYEEMTENFNREFHTKPLHFKDNLTQFKGKKLLSQLKEAAAIATARAYEPNVEDQDMGEVLERHHQGVPLVVEPHHQDRRHIDFEVNTAEKELLAKLRREGPYKANTFRQVVEPDQPQSVEQHAPPDAKMGPGEPTAELPSVQNKAQEKETEAVASQIFPTKEPTDPPARPPDPTLDEGKTPGEQRHPQEHSEVQQVGAQPPDPAQKPKAAKVTGKRKRTNRMQLELERLGVAPNHQVSELPPCGHSDQLHRKPAGHPRGNPLCAMHRVTKRLKLSGEIPQPGHKHWRSFLSTLRRFKR